MITEEKDGYIIFTPENSNEEAQLVECVNEGLYDYDGTVYYKVNNDS